jgi:hypothetical protein
VIRVASQARPDSHLCDWTSDEGKVGPRTTPRSLNKTGDRKSNISSKKVRDKVIRQIQLDDSENGAAESIDEGGSPVIKGGDPESMSSEMSRAMDKVTSQGEDSSDYIDRNETGGGGVHI